jgi:hypothetical protein
MEGNLLRKAVRDNDSTIGLGARIKHQEMPGPVILLGGEVHRPPFSLLLRFIQAHL